MLTVILVTVLGLLVGSAVNALVWRLKVRKSWVKGRSECPECGHQLAARDLVPVVSWVALRGCCRYCKKPISWQYPVVEVVTALVFGISAWRLAPADMVGWLVLGWWLVMATMLLVLAVYDARWQILPDRVMVWAGAWAVLPLVAHAIRAEWGAVTGPLAAGAVVFGGFYLLVAVSKGRAMGGGDVKLVLVMGLILGLQAMAVAMLVGFYAGAVVALVLLAARLKGRRDRMAFGPYLIGGAIVGYLYGREIFDWYLRMNGL